MAFLKIAQDKNVQQSGTVGGISYSSTSTMTDSGVSLTVSATGIYTISFVYCATTSSGSNAMHMQIYQNGSGISGTNSFYYSNTAGCAPTLYTATNIALSKNDVIKVYGYGEGSGISEYIGDLLLVQTA